jgi:group I intron endonuclease
LTVYVITNNVNDRVYVGKTVGTLATRWNLHVFDAFSANSSLPIHRAMRKYGREAFSISALATASSLEDLNAQEIAFIAKLESISKGYNITPGGDGGWAYANQIRLSRPRTEETKLRIRKGHLGKRNSEEAKRRMSESHRGIHAGSRNPMSRENRLRREAACGD